MVDAQIAALTPLLILAVLGFLLPTFGAFRMDRTIVAAITLVGLLLSGLTAAASVYPIPGLGFMPEVGPEDAFIMFRALEITPFVVFFQIVFLLVAALVVLASPSYLESRHQGEYYGLLVFSTLGMMVAAASRDLIALFVGFEITSFSTFALASYYKRSLTSTEAGMKFFIIGAVSSSLTLFGISIVYGLTGGTSFAELGAYSQRVIEGILQREAAGEFAVVSPLLVFAWGLLLAGFGFKVALVPFHNWAPDVYTGSPTSVSAFLAAGTKKVGFVALFKVFLVGLIAIKANWLWVGALLAIVTMTVGNVSALQQTSIKRMLAYSSIAQAGYMMIAIPVATQLALAGGLFYILVHGFMKAGAFLAVAAVAAKGIGDRMDDWAGLGRRAPLMAFSMAVFLLSLAGFPPLAGFAAKFVLFSGAIDAFQEVTEPARWWFLALAIAGILNSAISLFYYARVMRTMYVDQPTTTLRVYPGSAVTAAVVIALALTIAVGLFPGPLIDFSLEAAASLLLQSG